MLKVRHSLLRPKGGPIQPQFNTMTNPILEPPSPSTPGPELLPGTRKGLTIRHLVGRCSSTETSARESRAQTSLREYYKPGLRVAVSIEQGQWILTSSPYHRRRTLEQNEYTLTRIITFAYEGTVKLHFLIHEGLP